jgi:uncharacterized membrane protein
LTAKKNWINIILSLVGIVIVLLYMICDESCAYLEGYIFGLPLHYAGIFYMGIVLITYLLKKRESFLLLLSAGLGAELRLFGFQIQNEVYCPYCLSFGAVILLLFLLNFEKSKKLFIGVSLVLGLILFTIFFNGSATPAYADDIVMPSFGNGKIQVRLYTDYFCNPCEALEPKIEPVVVNLVKEETITITFIDTPIHPQTTLYAKYFLYIVHENKDFKHALRARAVLFEAAKKKIKDSMALETFIKEKGIKFKPFDLKATFDIFNECLKKDKIKATPTCVIYKDGKRDEFTGLPLILEALKRL